MRSIAVWALIVVADAVVVVMVAVDILCVVGSFVRSTKRQVVFWSTINWLLLLLMSLKLLQLLLLTRLLLLILLLLLLLLLNRNGMESGHVELDAR